MRRIVIALLLMPMLTIAPAAAASDEKPALPPPTDSVVDAARAAWIDNNLTIGARTIPGIEDGITPGWSTAVRPDPGVYEMTVEGVGWGEVYAWSDADASVVTSCVSGPTCRAATQWEGGGWLTCRASSDHLVAGRCRIRRVAWAAASQP